MNSFDTSGAELVLIGAGPGDPELLTVKAWKVLGRADVILYDHLANPALLELAPAGCECICVGKEPYGLSTPQEVIHALIEEKARRGGIIVRLKGGDPFIFGRGFEEVQVARELGMKVTYIPGITSMQTSGLTGIPLTHRAVSDGIWMLTGTKQDGALSADLRLAMKSRSTVVIYMGMKKLQEIANAYLQEGLGEVPAAIIQHGSLPHQRMAVGVVAALPKMAEEYRLSHPAVIVIGEVVAVGRGGGQLGAQLAAQSGAPPAAQPFTSVSISALNSFKNS